ncbi:methyltransferase domain-containing protein [Parasphingorhabdus sp.]|uniref:class I SAM-dependent methyltransferase n=2 Tax=Parasphingorhabdus sp. TaxID=2709688 RepID=UPI0039E6F224
MDQIQMTKFDKYDDNGAYHWRECDRRSPVYNPPLVARYGLILDRARGACALDVGAGDGYLTARLAENCENVIGLEYETAGVAAANKMLAIIPNARVQQGSAYAMPFKDDSYDVITMADVIEHLDAPEQAVLEMARVAAPESETYVTTPQWRPDRVWDKRHVKEYTPSELKQLMEVGFNSVEMVYAWPRRWSDFYRTKIGWRALRLAGKMGFNPFTSESSLPNGYCQMLAIARSPR